MMASAFPFLIGLRVGFRNQYPPRALLFSGLVGIRLAIRPVPSVFYYGTDFLCRTFSSPVSPSLAALIVILTRTIISSLELTPVSPYDVLCIFSPLDPANVTGAMAPLLFQTDVCTR